MYVRAFKQSRAIEGLLVRTKIHAVILRVAKAYLGFVRWCYSGGSRSYADLNPLLINPGPGPVKHINMNLVKSHILNTYKRTLLMNKSTFLKDGTRCPKKW